MVLRSYIRGAWLAAETWPLTLVLWLINAIFGVVFALASGYWLALVLDGSLATRTLLKTLDAQVLVDLYRHHATSFRMLLVLAAFIAAHNVLLWFWLHGVVVCAVRAEPDEKWRRVWWRGLRLAPVMAGLYGLALALVAVLSGAVWGAVWEAQRWTVASTSAALPDAIYAAAAVLWAVGYVLLAAVHDHARLRACAADCGVLAAYGWAWRFVLRGGEGAIPLAIVLQATALALWLVYQLIGLALPVNEILGVTGSLLWGEVFLCTRMAMRVWCFAAQSELQA